VSNYLKECIYRDGGIYHNKVNGVGEREGGERDTGIILQNPVKYCVDEGMMRKRTEWTEG